MIRYCTRCLYSSVHPLHLTFDAEGVCSGCRVHEEKDSANWEERGLKLKNILAAYRNTSGNNYDCIIPVSGARDSWFIVHTIRNVYGMNPLLVTYNKHYNTSVGIRNLAYLRTVFGCDLLTLTVDPTIVKKITRATLRKMGSIYWHCIAGQTVFPVQVAVKFKIPLIVWGAHQGIDQVGMFSHFDEVEMTRKYRKEHDLMGYEAEDLIDDFDGITETDIVQYKYPHDKEIERVGVRGIYLNNYIRWDSKAQHEQMINMFGYESAIQTRTFDTYNDVDCFHYSDLHDYIKYIKYGYGKVVDHANREIRLKRLNREEGSELVNHYINKEPQSLSLFLDWMGLTESGFWYLLNQHRDPRIWVRDEHWIWKRKQDLFSKEHDAVLINSVRLEKKESCQFIITPSRNKNKDKTSYTLIGKGYPC